MEKKSDRYENKPIRFYDKGDHYELWFMDDFTNPGSGKMMKSGSEYTLICDIAEELFNGDINKELHIFIWSYGGLVDTLSTILQGISRYRRKVAVNLGVCDSAGWMLFFSCDERYASSHSEFMYHEAWMFSIGKIEEVANDIEYKRRRRSAFELNIDVTKYLTDDEKKLGETSEVWLTGDDMILRGACRDYSEYHNRIAPKMIKNEFFSFDNKIFRYIDGMMVEYTRTDNETDDYLLTSYKSIPNFNRDLDRCENVLACLLNKVSKIKKQKSQKSKQTDVSLTEEERLVLAKMIGTFKE